jgi:hypothetical protein
MQEAARAELKARMANSSDAELRALAGIVEIEQPKEPRPKGKVESRELVPVKVPEHKFNKVEHVAPEPRGSVTDSPGSPFNMNGGGPQVGSRTPDGGVVTDISCNVKFK